MATLCFRIKSSFFVPLGMGTAQPARVLSERLGLAPIRAKALVDRAALGDEEVSVEVVTAEMGWQLARELESSLKPARLRAWVERGRLEQDESFEMRELLGRRVEKMFGIFRTEVPNDLTLLYLKADAPPWHRLFLDGGVAIWEDWGRGLENEELDGAVIKDLGASCRLVGDRVSTAAARVSEARSSTVIDLGFASGARLEVYFTTPSSPASSVSFAFTRRA